MSTRIFKTDVSQNRFMQLFFSETVAISVLTVAVALPIYIFTNYTLEIKLFLIFVFGTIFAIIFLFKIDNQNFYKLIPSIFSFFTKKNTYNHSQIAKETNYLYKIKDNLVFTKNSILTVIQIFPVDISILSDQDKELFKARMGTFLHAINKDFVQIIVSSRMATLKDYEGHFNDIYIQAGQKQANGKIIKLINEYVDNLSNKITNERVPFKDYFLILPVITVNRPSKKELEKYIQEMERKINFMTSILKDNDIETVRIQGTHLKEFYQAHLEKIN